MEAKRIAGLGLTLISWMTASAQGDDGWSPAAPPPAVVRAREVVASTQPATGAGVTLGRPVPVESAPASPAPSPPAPDYLSSLVFHPDEGKPTIIRAQAPDAVLPPGGVGAPPPPPPPPPPIVGNEAFNNGVVAPAPAGGGGFWAGCKDSFNRRVGTGFHSDLSGDFKQFSSPVTAPFYAEDPRSLTEVKPLFIYQTIPNDNAALRGGNLEFFGLQARLALTERWSIVMNKLGGVYFQPDNATGQPNQSGFAEVWIGPKYTFFRDDCNNVASAVGLTFQIPNSSNKLAQDTGSLSLAPYISFAASFGKIPNGFGSFNFMGTAGYSFGVDSQRSDYFYSTLHLDYDVAGQHKFYPLIELNWLRYTTAGGARAQNFEGGDLFNFGATGSSGQNLLTFAVGARYKFTECIQAGLAAEFPLKDNRDIFDFRITADVIFRY